MCLKVGGPIVSRNPGLLTLAIATGFWPYFQPFSSAHVTSGVKFEMPALEA